MTHSAPQFVSGKHPHSGAITLSPRTASKTGLRDKTKKETLYPRLRLRRCLALSGAVWRCLASALPIQLGMACVSERMVMRSMQVLTGISVRGFSRRWSGRRAARGCLNGDLGGFQGWAGIAGRTQVWVGGAEWDARAGTRSAPTGAVWGVAEVAPGRREGRHEACPYGGGLGSGGGGVGATRGQAQGLPLRIFGWGHGCGGFAGGGVGWRGRYDEGAFRG